MDELAVGEKSFVPYPVQGWITGQLRAPAVEAGRSDLLALWSGQSAPLVRYRKASELGAALIEETSAHLAQLVQTNRSEHH